MPRKDAKASKPATEPTQAAHTSVIQSNAVTQPIAPLDPNLIIRTFRPSDLRSLHKLYSSSYKGLPWRAVKSMLFRSNVAKIYAVLFGVLINILMFLFNYIKSLRAYSVQLTAVSIMGWTLMIPLMLWWFFRSGFKNNIKSTLAGELKDVVSTFRLKPEDGKEEEAEEAEEEKEKAESERGEEEDEEEEDETPKPIRISPPYVATTPSNFWVCVDTTSNEVVGCVGLEYKEPVPPAQPKKQDGSGELRRLVVHPKYASGSMMDVLVAESVQWARDHKLSKLFVLNLTTVHIEQQRAVERMGFKIIKTKPVFQGYEYLAYEMTI